MNKALYIIGIFFAIIFFFVIGFYIVDVNDARMDYVYNTTSTGYETYSSYNYDSGNANSLTEEAGFISLFFFLSFAAIDLLGLLKVKTKTAKVMAIIGMTFTGLFIFWDFAMISSPGSLSFDEVGMGFLLYCFIMLAFCIVGVVQSFQYSKMKRLQAIAQANNGGDALDS